MAYLDIFPIMVNEGGGGISGVDIRVVRGGRGDRFGRGVQGGHGRRSVQGNHGVCGT